MALLIEDVNLHITLRSPTPYGPLQWQGNGGYLTSDMKTVINRRVNSNLMTVECDCHRERTYVEFFFGNFEKTAF